MVGSIASEVAADDRGGAQAELFAQPIAASSGCVPHPGCDREFPYFTLWRQPGVLRGMAERGQGRKQVFVPVGLAHLICSGEGPRSGRAHRGMLGDGGSLEGLGTYRPTLRQAGIAPLGVGCG